MGALGGVLGALERFLEALGGVLEVLEGVLEALGGALETEVLQDSAENPQERKTSRIVGQI